MKTEVSILHHAYPPQVRDTVEEKLQHLVKFYDRTVSMRALLEKQNEEHRVEFVASVGQGNVLVVDARNESFGSALDEATERMTRVLTRHKTKQADARRRGGAERADQAQPS